MSLPFNDVIALAKQAGEQILAIYAKDFAVYDKADESPLTEADLASHRCIVEGLARLTPDIPVLSEESNDISTQERLSWRRYWLIDPLDGTKEFIKKNGEFTVNIALIEHHQPVWGVVYAPALDTLYYGDAGTGEAYKKVGIDSECAIRVASVPDGDSVWRVVGSRSHQSEEFKAFMADLPNADVVSMGSSLKLCLVAEGAADLYPRLGPTSEWDTAAAHAVVVAAGGQVLEFESGEPLRYNTGESILNPFFIVQAG